MKNYISMLALFLGLNAYNSTFTEHHLEALMYPESKKISESPNVLHDPVLATDIPTIDLTSMTPSSLEKPTETASPQSKAIQHPEPKGAHWPPTENEEEGDGDDEEMERTKEDAIYGADDNPFEYEVGHHE